MLNIPVEQILNKCRTILVAGWMWKSCREQPVESPDECWT